MNNQNTLAGLVLCGGKSTRMGEDKGLLLLKDQTWAEIAFQKLKKTGIPVHLSVNPDQKDKYLQLFDSSLLVVDSVAIPGPLAGVMSAHLFLKDQDLLLLACDMTDVSTDTIIELTEAFNANKERYDFFVYKNESEYEPMLGIYTSKGIQKAYALFKDGKMKKFSMKYLLETGVVFSIPVSENQKKEFKNYNSREDFSS